VRRKLSNFAAVVSLILCVGIVVLWALSNRRSYAVGYTASSGGGYAVGTTPGRITLFSSSHWREWQVFYTTSDIASWHGWWLTAAPYDVKVSKAWPGRAERIYMELKRPDEKWWRFQWVVSNNPADTTFGLPATRSRTVMFPMGLLIAALTVAPAISLWLTIRKRRRILHNHCLACGYDLTANTSGVCPECGTPVPWSAAA